MNPLVVLSMAVLHIMWVAILVAAVLRFRRRKGVVNCLQYIGPALVVLCIPVHWAGHFWLPILRAGFFKWALFSLRGIGGLLYGGSLLYGEITHPGISHSDEGVSE